ncbi:MAG: hypothetical protein ACI4ML_10255 [Aristaeellaceae bacterium]
MDLFWVLIVVGLIVRAVGNSRKKKEQLAKQQHQAMKEAFDQQAAKPSGAQRTEQKPAPKPAPVARPAEMLPPLRQEPAREAIAPRVHVHTAPACPVDDDTGSLHYQSTEGVDPCHEEQLPSMHAPRPEPVEPRVTEKPGLTLEWTGDSMVKAFIMQEVLTRPCERRGRR